MKINLTCLSCGAEFKVECNGIKYVHFGKENCVKLLDKNLTCPECSSERLNFTSNLKIKKEDYPKKLLHNNNKK
jgi:transcription elongation factor Elf1